VAQTERSLWYDRSGEFFSRHFQKCTFWRRTPPSPLPAFDPFRATACGGLRGARAALGRCTFENLPPPTGTIRRSCTNHTDAARRSRCRGLERHWHVLCDKPFVLKTSRQRQLRADASGRGWSMR